MPICLGSFPFFFFSILSVVVVLFSITILQLTDLRRDKAIRSDRESPLSLRYFKMCLDAVAKDINKHIMDVTAHLPRPVAGGSAASRFLQPAPDDPRVLNNRLLSQDLFEQFVRDQRQVCGGFDVVQHCRLASLCGLCVSLG